MRYREPLLCWRNARWKRHDDCSPNDYVIRVRRSAVVRGSRGRWQSVSVVASGQRGKGGPLSGGPGRSRYARPFPRGCHRIAVTARFGGKEQWYLAYSSNLDEPLVLEVQSPPIAERFLPDEGFILADADVPFPNNERTFSPPTRSAQVRAHQRTGLRGTVAPTASGLINRPVASKTT